MVLHGLPGIGKTQLATRFCRRYEQDYKVILWTTADTETKMLAALSHHSVGLKLVGAQAPGGTSENCTLLLNHLESIGVFMTLFKCENG